jgi:diacylglycerol kinase (ATP)
VRIGIIENPRSGAAGARRVLPAVERFAARYADEVRVVSCGRTDRIETLARNLAAIVEQIIVVGGDGTLNGVVNGVLVSSNPDVGVTFLPAGRGKDTARTLPFLSNADLERIDVDWLHRHIDAGVVHTKDERATHFINISSLGLGATAARYASRLPRFPGTTCYLLGAAGGLLREPAVDVRMQFDDQPEISLDQCRLVAVANSRYFGGGLHIAPMALPDDGFLEVVTVSGASRIEILRRLPRVFAGTHMSHPAVRHWKARTVTINATPAIGIETDGEVLGQVPGTFSVMPGALNWMVPR